MFFFDFDKDIICSDSARYVRRIAENKLRDPGTRNSKLTEVTFKGVVIYTCIYGLIFTRVCNRTAEN